jgi:hypothetical protein
MNRLKFLLINLICIINLASCQQKWERTNGFCTYDNKGKLYYVGGEIPGKDKQTLDSPMISLDLSDSNNFATPNWKSINYKMKPSSMHTAGDYLDGKIYFFGVSDDMYSGKLPQTDNDTTTLFVYDTAKDSLESKLTPLGPLSRYGHQFKAIGQKSLWTFGGQPPDLPGQGYGSDVVALLDTDKKDYTKVPIDFFVIYKFSAVLVKDRLLLFGGAQNADVPYPMNKIKFWNVPSGIFGDVIVQSSENPKPRINPMTFAKGDKVYMFGGSDPQGKEFYNDLWEFDTNSATWTEMKNPELDKLPGRANGCFVIYNDQFVMVQGNGKGNSSLPISSISLKSALSTSPSGGSSATSDSKEGLSKSAITGIGVGVAAVLLLLGIGMYLVHRKNQSRKSYYSGKSYMTYMEFHDSYSEPIWSDPYTRRASFCTVRDLAEGETTPESQMDVTLSSDYVSNASSTQNLINTKNMITLPSAYSSRDRPL